MPFSAHPAEPGPPDVMLVLGVSWPGREPHLRTTHLPSGTSRLLPLLGHELGFTTSGDGPWCTGWYDATRARHLPCPDGRPADGSGVCADCALRDQFRFVHHGHTGGYVPASLERVLAAPHWLYLATFADGFTKVGTAVAHRRQERIDEQGAVLASYVAAAEDGRVVREAEDVVTAELEVPQHRRRAAKVAALARPAPRPAVAERHQETVDQVVALLGHAGLGSGLRPVAEEWTPPAAHAHFAQAPPSGSWLSYPHDLRQGDHGLQVESAAGAAVLVRTEPGPEASRYVADLGQLRGTRIVLGPYTSPVAEVQEPLF